MSRAAVLGLVLLSQCRPATKNVPARVEADAVWIPPGELVRGHDDPDREDEAPRHRVALGGFWMDRTLVTRRAYLAFADRTGYRTSAERAGFGIASSEGMEDWEWERVPGASFRRPFREGMAGSDAFLHPDAPAVMISHDDAAAYCTDRRARLPTEAEWEWAMRADRVGARYPWGEEPADGPAYRLNFWQGASHAKNERLDGFVYVSPVRAFPPTARGLYDPVGNVWQWTADFYAKDTYAVVARAGVARDPRGPDHGDKRVLRGGSFWCGQCTCEGNGLSYRGKGAPDSAFSNNGFRCVHDAVGSAR